MTNHSKTLSKFLTDQAYPLRISTRRGEQFIHCHNMHQVIDVLHAALQTYKGLDDLTILTPGDEHIHLYRVLSNADHVETAIHQLYTDDHSESASASLHICSIIEAAVVDKYIGLNQSGHTTLQPINEADINFKALVKSAYITSVQGSIDPVLKLEVLICGTYETVEFNDINKLYMYEAKA